MPLFPKPQVCCDFRYYSLKPTWLLFHYSPWYYSISFQELFLKICCTAIPGNIP